MTQLLPVTLSRYTNLRRDAPLATLALFLAASGWHFGLEDAVGLPLIGKLFVGGLPMAVFVLVHANATVACWEQSRRITR